MNMPLVAPYRTLWIFLAASLLACRGDSVFPEPSERPYDPGGPISPSVETLQMGWRVSVRGWAKPSVDATTAYFAGWHHDVVAVNKTTGAIRWQRKTPASDNSVPTLVAAVGVGTAVTDDAIIVGDNLLYAFAKDDGALLWTFTPSIGRKPGAFVPCVWNGLVIAGSASGHVYAIDARTGQSVWTTTLFPPETAPSISVYDPIVDEGTVFASYTIFSTGAGIVDVGGVVALDAATGRLKWAVQFPKLEQFLPSAALSVVIHGNLVVSTARDGTIYALNKQTGQQVWTAPKVTLPAESPYPSPTLDTRYVAACNGRLFVGSTAQYVMAYNMTNGQKLWQGTAYRGSSNYPLSCDAELVYVLYAGGQIGVFDAASGTLRYLFDPPPGTDITCGLALDGKTLYANGSIGLVALRRP